MKIKPIKQIHVQRQQYKHWKNVLNTFEATSQDNFWSFYCQLWTYFAPFSGVSTVEFEQVNVYWIEKFSKILLAHP